MELVLFGVEKLSDRLGQEYEQFQGVKDQVTELKSNLNLLKSFLKDADAKKHTHEMVRHCVEEIKEIVYNAEDIIETFILKEKVGGKSGIMKHIRRFASTIVDRRELASDIRCISKRISKVIQDMQSFGVQQMIAEGTHSSNSLQEKKREMRQTFSKDYESDLVGLETNVKKLVGYMVEEDDIQILSVTGMGGLGKTTLARQVFNHEDVKHHFDGLAWVCVSQEFTRISVWQKILQNFTSIEKKDEILKMKEDDLHGELSQLLETSKSLIVFDDIWKEEDWDLIKPIFPPKKGWKVLLTSRNESIAVRGDSKYINFKLECLTIQDSWTLFQRTAMPSKEASESKVDEEMEELGKQMIKHCGGLPLAVKVLGGLLAAKYTLHSWKRVYENIGSHLVGGRTGFNVDNNSSFNYVLSLSFEELPNYLKHCFLYLAHYPEDCDISVERFSYRWAADEMSKLRHYEGKTIRDVGELYIEELARRNMVISQRDVSTLRFETCRLHDMMRQICLLKAKEENFLQLVDTSSTAYSKSPGISRRFVSHYPKILNIKRDVNNIKARSLIVLSYNNVWRKKWILSSLVFKRLQLLRLLDISGAKFEGGKLPSGIGKLIHLRYLSIKGVTVSHLPSSLGNLMLLIFLDINVDIGCKKCIFVPNVLMRMEELRHLTLPMSMSRKTKLELSNLVNLETLENFSTRHCSLDDLCGMVKLRNLVVSLTSEITMENLSASIGLLRHLEVLNVNEPSQDYKSDRKKHEEVVLDFIHLKTLSLSIHMPRLPKEQKLPSHLTGICLYHCCLEEDPMPILEKMLHLKDVSLWPRSFYGRRMVCSGSGFPQLLWLFFIGLDELDEWIVEEGSLPLLHTLSIWNCPKLKKLPDGLQFIYSLKNLRMDKEWKERLSEGGDEYGKVQQIPFVTFKGQWKEDD